MLALRTFVLLLLVLGVAAPTALARPSDVSDRMIEEINTARESRGLAKLREAPKLVRGSRRHARHMMRTDSFSHDSANESRAFRRGGEILALIPRWRPRTGTVVGMWLRSGGHAGVMLDPTFRYIGASPVRGRFGGRLMTMWVVRFGAH